MKPLIITAVGTGGGGGPAPYLAPPLFMVHLSLPCPWYQFISCHTLGSTALALVCVRGHFRVLENEKFSTPCERENPSNTLPNLVAPFPRMCGPPPTFKYVATPMIIWIMF